jgi:hypothetical protein
MFAAGQHVPSPAGIRPDAQHRGPIGMRVIATHWFLFGPLGVCPLGQQALVDVIWLARQQEPPVET